MSGERFVLVDVETAHFQFRACGRTEREARIALSDAWLLHCERTGADPDHVQPFEDGNVFNITIPGAWIDHERVIGGEPSRAGQGASQAPDASPVLAILEAIGKLREARELLKFAGAPRSADYVRRAMKSAEGAARHARRMEGGRQ